MTRMTGGFNDDHDDHDDDPRALAARLPRRDASGLVSSQRYSRPWSRSTDRPMPQPIADPEAARPLGDLFGIAAQGGDLDRRDLNALVWADGVSDYRADVIRGQIKSRYAEIRKMRAEGRLADARAAARVAVGEFAGYLAAERPADEYRGLDPRELVRDVPRRV